MWPEGQPPVGIAIAGVASAYLAIFGLAEIIRRVGVRGTVTRRAAHLASTAPALAAPWLFASAEPVLFLGLGFALLMASSRRLGLLGSIHDIPRRSLGAILYPVAVAAAFVVAASPAQYLVAVLALGVGDALAAVVGDSPSRHTFWSWGTPRSIEGSIAAAVASGLCAVLVLVTVADLDILPALAGGIAVGVAAALAEAGTPLGIDNLTMPAAALTAVALPLPFDLLLIAALGVWVAAGLGRTRSLAPSPSAATEDAP